MSTTTTVGFLPQSNYITGPTQIPGLTAWYDAADATTVSLSGGSNITAVRDKSGNGYTLSNGGCTYPNNTFNGTYPSFYSSAGAILGTTASNIFSLPQPFSMFLVGLVNNSYLIASQNSYIYMTILPTQFRTGTNTITGQNNNSQFFTTLSNTFFGEVVMNGVSSSGWGNGTQAGTGTVGPLQGFYTSQTQGAAITSISGNGSIVTVNFASTTTFVGISNITILFGGGGTGTAYNGTFPITPPVGAVSNLTYSSAVTVTPSTYSSAYVYYSNGWFQSGTLSVGNNGHLCELIFYNGTLTTTQRQQVEDYLGWKWGLQGKFPATHPYAFSSNLPGYNVSLPAITQFAFSSNILSGYSVPLPAITQMTYTPWLPTQITGLSVWLDAADPTTITLSGTTVTLWTDKSGGGRNATPISGPTYSAPNISLTNSSYFTGSLNIAAGTLVTTAFSVAISPSVYTGNSNRLLSANDGTGLDYLSPTGAQYSSANSNGAYQPYRPVTVNSNITVTPLGIPVSTRFLATTIYNSNGTYLLSLNGNYPNGSSNYYTPNNAFYSNSSATNALTKYYLGAYFSGGNYWKGYINEIIIFNRTLSQREYQQVEGYLAWKWGLQGSLPATHPNAFMPTS